MPSNAVTLPVFFDGFDDRQASCDSAFDSRQKLVLQRRHRLRNDRRLRVVLYSHDTMGLGHIRRNILLAQCLCESDPAIDVLLITGARESGGFNLPEGVDVVVLPALHKAVDGSYGARNLDLPLDDLTAIRSQIVCSTIKSFQPDLVIVDNVARCVNGELDAALSYIQQHGGIRCVLGLRDIQDEPENVVREWQQQKCLSTIRNIYHAVWVYGDARVFDPRQEYSLPRDIARKIQFTGYLDPRIRARVRQQGETGRVTSARPFGLCLVGGGQDGAALALAFAAATHPAGMDAVIITGPYIDPESMAKLQALARQRPGLKLLEFVAEPTEMLRDAAYVVSMGGYNSVCEVVAFGKPALVVPRVVPRREQIIRAERLRDLGIIDMLHPDDLDANRLSTWIASLAGKCGPASHGILDMNAIQRVPQYFVEQIMQLGQPLENHLCWAEL